MGRIYFNSQKLEERLSQHILSLGAVNRWNSLLPFGMLQRKEEGSFYKGRSKGLYTVKLASMLAFSLDCSSQ